MESYLLSKKQDEVIHNPVLSEPQQEELAKEKKDIAYCNAWSIERRWLNFYEIDFSQYPEEKTF